MSDDHVSHVLAQWRQELPNLDRSGFAVVGRIARLAQLLASELDDVFSDFGLTAGEFDVLAALRRIGRPYRLNPSALSDALLVTSGGMAKRLAGLEGRGLISRHPDSADGRGTLVKLTRDGRRLVDAVMPPHTVNEARLLAALQTNEQHNLARLLEKLAVSLGDTANRRSRGRRPARQSTNR